MKVLNHVLVNNSKRSDKHGPEHLLHYKRNMFLVVGKNLISTTSDDMIYVHQGIKASRRNLC